MEQRLKDGLGTFGDAKWALDNGLMVARSGWNGKGLFVFKQVPAQIGVDIIPKMQSLPEAVKIKLASRGDIYYHNQLALVYPNNYISGWSPSASDAMAEDWCLIE